MLYLSATSNQIVSSGLSTGWLTGSVQTHPEPSQWKTASVQSVETEIDIQV